MAVGLWRACLHTYIQTHEYSTMLTFVQQYISKREYSCSSPNNTIQLHHSAYALDPLQCSFFSSSSSSSICLMISWYMPSKVLYSVLVRQHQDKHDGELHLPFWSHILHPSRIFKAFSTIWSRAYSNPTFRNPNNCFRRL